uniref:Cytochrome P450 n=1 Tax=Timema monikensis TaxID=170555 RepID=A0A7R9EAK5_9NEOP|nr:unnamed protein product [Timema monikensis]
MMLSYLAVIFVAVVLYFLSNWIKCVMVVWGLPGPPAVPVLGHALLASDNKRLVHMGSKVYLEYGPLVKIWLTFFPTVLVLSPEYLQGYLLENVLQMLRKRSKSSKRIEQVCVLYRNIYINKMKSVFVMSMARYLQHPKG